MAYLEYNFDDQFLELIRTSESDQDVLFQPHLGHFIRLSVFDDLGNFVTSYKSNLDTEGRIIYYIPDTAGGDGTLRGWILQNEFGQGIETYGGIPQLKIYETKENGTLVNFYVKPTDSLAHSALSDGNYSLQFDFILDTLSYWLDEQWYPEDGSVTPSTLLNVTDPKFVVKEISPSRKELRIMPMYSGTEPFIFDLGFRDSFKSLIGEPDSTYNFDWVVGLAQSRNLPIVNYQFDLTSATPSIILKLSESAPSDLLALDTIDILKEVITTHTELIWYKGTGAGEIFPGFGIERFGLLEVDTNDQGIDAYESYAELTGSLTDTSIEKLLLSGSGDVNLDNLDYSSFGNHTFFGSVTSKLDKFKTKVKNIEGYLVNLSASLSGSGIELSGDSDHRAESRQTAFLNIQKELDNFTPYEKFLYYDNQQTSTGSAPGLGANLTHNIPVATGSYVELTNHDGFGIVYQHLSKDNYTGPIDLFRGKYYAHQPPFFNYSGSLYLSFLMKGHHAVSGTLGPINTGDGEFATIDGKLGLGNSNVTLPNVIPKAALGSGSLLVPNITGSEWRKFVFAASQSYWRPRSTYRDNWYIWEMPSAGSNDWTLNPSAKWEILSQSGHINMASNSPTGSSYPILTFGDFYPNISSTVTASGVLFTGSFMPSGELFRMSWLDAVANNGANTASFMTDIKITKKDPTNIYPFSNIYKTTSTEWDNWYTKLQVTASEYDASNIHSLVNNLPRLIKDDQDSIDLKRFVNMVGEQYDLIRNYIDNYTSLYNRRYNKNDSVPPNLLPILSENMGWELISPFTGSLSQYFGTSEQDIRVGGRTTQEITNNTWRKVLNNLIYVYKTKGTRASVNALLNTYGYPPDTVGIQEFGGSTQEHNPTVITQDVKKMLQGIGGSTDNISFIKFKEELYSYIFNNNFNRFLHFDWNTNDANDIETVEFVMKPFRSNYDMTILANSGSLGETLWDLRLLATGSDDYHGKLQFRLNFGETGSLNITSSAVSMSTDYLQMKGQGLWNVMLQRMHSNISGSGTQQYKLWLAQQEGEKITQLVATSMSISGGIVAASDYEGGRNFYANQNWYGTGSLPAASSSNLYVARNYTGSLAEFRAWNNALSASKFKQHILNKKSVVGNNLRSALDDIIYRYPLQENWKTGSTEVVIKDATKHNIKDYSIVKSTDLLTSSVLYDRDEVDIVKFSVRIGGSNQPNDNKIIIQPTEPLKGNLNFAETSHKSIYDKVTENKRTATTKIQIVRSPQKVINEFILENIGDFDLSNKFADPQDLYKKYYEDLDELNYDLFNSYEVDIKINKWIRGQSSFFNKSLLRDIKATIPARTTTNDIGVLFEPSLLERNKIENPTITPLTGSDIGQLFAEPKFLDNITLEQVVFTPKEGFIDIEQKSIPIDYTDNIDVKPTVFKPSIADVFGATNKNTKLSKPWIITASLDDSGIVIAKEVTHDIVDEIDLQNTSLHASNDISMGIGVNFSSSVVTVPEGTNIYITSQSYDSFTNIINSWGRGEDDMHFVNMAWNVSDNSSGFQESGSGTINGWKNVNFYETRYVFQSLGDREVISSSRAENSDFSFTDWSDDRYFKYREVRDRGKGFTYKSYIKVGGNVEGPQDGRPVGKTAYYATQSLLAGRNDILYPSNHWINFSEDPMRIHFTEGYQNKGGHFQEHPEFEDLSTASFYSVDVTGENQLIVRRGKRIKGPSGTVVNRT